ncbi:MAG: polysaccharide deacetylase family protein [Spirochaetes bacterium]|nr:polysaccharide deacetylase family protein [Spirochaetota bacterium]
MIRPFNIPIIMYHEITPEHTSPLSITPKAFRSQLNALRIFGFTPINFTDLENIMRGAKRPKKPVILTFDDGFMNFKEHAHPILKSFRYKSTVFLVTGCIGKTNVWDKKKKEVMQQPLLSKADIISLAEEGVEFGSHSHTHRDVTMCRTVAERAEEINRPYEIIKAITGKPVTAFCYPYGHHDEISRNYIEAKTMHRFGVVIQSKPLPKTTSDPFLVSRVFIKPNDFLFRFLWKVYKRRWWNVDFVNIRRK